MKNNKLIPTFGIQGGKGSFNEQALTEYVTKHGIDDYNIEYLYTTSNVLKALTEGKTDFGLFAFHNSVGGAVTESFYAMADFTFNIVEEFFIIISHHLMKLPDVPFEEIDTIMAHPQVLKQCQTTLAEKYTKYKKISGEGNLIDTATAAKALVDGEIPKNTAILGPKVMAELFDLTIVAKDLQDNSKNYTSFLMCTKK